MITEVDAYLSNGCGRCKFYNTPKCKVNDWREELTELRRIVNESGLTEELKWSVPTYTLAGKNVLQVSALREAAILSFFKGSLLKDPEEFLVAPGKHSQAVRMFRFTSVKQIQQNESTIKSYIKEAIELEKAGKQVQFKKPSDIELPEELEIIFAENPALKEAFYALTPGRRRGYILFFSGAKQSATRAARIEKYIPQILAGKGMQD